MTRPEALTRADLQRQMLALFEARDGTQTPQGLATEAVELAELHVEHVVSDLLIATEEAGEPYGVLQRRLDEMRAARGYDEDAQLTAFGERNGLL